MYAGGVLNRKLSFDTGPNRAGGNQIPPPTTREPRPVARFPFNPCILDRATGQNHIAAVNRVYAVGYAVGQLATGDIDSPAVDQFQQRPAARLPFRVLVMDRATGQHNVVTADHPDAGSIHGGVPAKYIAVHGNMTGILEQQVTIRTRVNAVAADGHPTATCQMDIVFLVADDVPADRPKMRSELPTVCRVNDSNVRPS